VAVLEFSATVAAATQVASVDVTDIVSLTGVTTPLANADFLFQS
jgi:hypothetical protein